MPPQLSDRCRPAIGKQHLVVHKAPFQLLLQPKIVLDDQELARFLGLGHGSAMLVVAGVTSDANVLECLFEPGVVWVCVSISGAPGAAAPGTLKGRWIANRVPAP